MIESSVSVDLAVCAYREPRVRSVIFTPHTRSTWALRARFHSFRSLESRDLSPLMNRKVMPNIASLRRKWTNRCAFLAL